MKTEFDEDLKPRIEELEEDQKNKLQEIKKDVMAAVKKVAKSVGVDVILQQGAIIDGGFDLTALTLEELNN